MRPAVPPDAERRDDAVAAAMRTVDRRGFLPRAQRRWAAQDRPLAIGHGQTSAQPSTVAAMLRLLGGVPGARAVTQRDDWRDQRVLSAGGGGGAIDRA